MAEQTLLNNEYIKYCGRYYYDSNLMATFFGFSLSGFMVKFKGSYLQADVITNILYDKYAYISVLVDDEFDASQARVIQLSEGEKKVTLVEGLTDMIHTVRVLKRSEAKDNHIGFKKIYTNGVFMKKPEDSKLKIEFYGDSLSCGYGILGEEGTPATTDTHDALRSFCYVAANDLNADFQVIGASGYPLYKSLYNQGVAIDNIPDFVNLASYDEKTSKSNVIFWNNKNFVPDVVVVYLGTNDATWFSNRQVSWFDKICLKYEALGYKGDMLSKIVKKDSSFQIQLNSFKAKYKSFIETLLILYPNTHIIVATGMLNIIPEIEEAIDIVCKNFNNSVTRFYFDTLNVGGDLIYGHPNEAMHRLAGHQLAKLIMTKSPEKFNI